MEVEVKIEVTEAAEVTEVGGPVWRPPGGPLDPIGDEPLKKFRKSIGCAVSDIGYENCLLS